MALRVLGHRLTWFGGRGASAGWSREIQDRYQSRSGDLFISETEPWRVPLLYRARQILLEGGTIFISADGIGREALSVPLPVSPAFLQAGWLTLRRTTAATVLPVLSHMEARAQVVTIHPLLRPIIADPVRDLDSCRRALAGLLGDYVRRFPKQCFSLAFPSQRASQRGPGHTFEEAARGSQGVRD